MAELENKDIYACALPMPSPDNPIPTEWNEEIDRQIKRSLRDEVYLVGHSLGVPAILRYLETLSEEHPIKGIVLVSGPAKSVGREFVDKFLDQPFNFELIKCRVTNVAVIHGDNDPNVPLDHAHLLSEQLNAKLVIIPNGGHLNGSSGWKTLPQALEVLKEIMTDKLP